MAADYGKGHGRKNRIAKAERAAAWRQAIAEGRVVRIVTPDNDMTCTACLTAEIAQRKLAEAHAAGFEAAIVSEN
jgi:hypothetical protein